MSFPKCEMLRWSKQAFRTWYVEIPETDKRFLDTSDTCYVESSFLPSKRETGSLWWNSKDGDSKEVLLIALIITPGSVRGLTSLLFAVKRNCLYRCFIIRSFLYLFWLLVTDFGICGKLKTYSWGFVVCGLEVMQ